MCPDLFSVTYCRIISSILFESLILLKKSLESCTCSPHFPLLRIKSVNAPSLRDIKLYKQICAVFIGHAGDVVAYGGVLVESVGKGKII